MEPTKDGRVEYLSTRPVASLIYERIQNANLHGEYPRSLEVLEEVHGDEMTAGQRSSGYAIIAELIDLSYVAMGIPGLPLHLRTVLLEGDE